MRTSVLVNAFTLAALVLLPRAQNIMTYNGGGVVAMTGKNCVAIARLDSAAVFCASFPTRASTLNGASSAIRSRFRNVG
jgi:hypothetical protein